MISDDRRHGHPGRARERWAAPAVVCLGLFLLGMDLTILNVAVPDLQRELRPSMAQVQWIVDAYALVLGGTVLTSGAATDRIGRRRAFICGLAVCGAASVLGALSPTPGPVIAARCGMGAGAALLMPATLSIISNLFPEAALRRRAIALWAATLGLGGMMGPVIGGMLVQRWSWRAGFWVKRPTGGPGPGPGPACGSAKPCNRERGTGRRRGRAPVGVRSADPCLGSDRKPGEGMDKHIGADRVRHGRRPPERLYRPPKPPCRARDAATVAAA